MQESVEGLFFWGAGDGDPTVTWVELKYGEDKESRKRGSAQHYSSLAAQCLLGRSNPREHASIPVFRRIRLRQLGRRNPFHCLTPFESWRFLAAMF